MQPSRTDTDQALRMRSHNVRGLNAVLSCRIRLKLYISGYNYKMLPPYCAFKSIENARPWEV